MVYLVYLLNQFAGKLNLKTISDSQEKPRNKNLGKSKKKLNQNLVNFLYKDK